MKFTPDQIVNMRKQAEADATSLLQEGEHHPDWQQVADGLLCGAAADLALEAAAAAFEKHNRENRHWVNGSLWGNLTAEGCARIRALKEGA